MSGVPGALRPDVRAEFVDALRGIDETEGLVRAATAFSRHEIPQADVRDVLAHLAGLGDRVLARSRRGSPKARLSHLHGLLFDEEGFTGNASSYYDPMNSYLPAVLSTRLGIPISLALVYRAVAERAGLRVEGIGAPGHFLVRVDLDGDVSLVDPFGGGRVLSADEAYLMMERALGTQVPRSAPLLPPVTNLQWLSRMLRNLEAVFTATARSDDLMAIHALLALLS